MQGRVASDESHQAWRRGPSTGRRSRGTYSTFQRASDETRRSSPPLRHTHRAVYSSPPPIEAFMPPTATSGASGLDVCDRLALALGDALVFLHRRGYVTEGVFRPCEVARSNDVVNLSAEAVPLGGAYVLGLARCRRRLERLVRGVQVLKALAHCWRSWSNK